MKMVLKRLKLDKANAIEALAKLAEGKDSTICGHKFTLVERAGSVNTPTVVKDYLPDLDLDPYRGKPVSMEAVVGF